MKERDLVGLIFDLDGTLIESAAAITAVANSFLETLSLSPLDLKETISFIGGGSQQFVRLMLESRQAYEASQFTKHFAEFSEIYVAASPELNQPFPGVESALRALAGLGHPLALCTNKPAAPTHRIVEALGWSDLFSAVIAGDSMAVKKPDPAPLLEAGKGMDSQFLIFVGDSETDAETAERADKPFVLFTEGYRKTSAREIHHAASFSHYDQFIAVVEALMAELSQARD